MIYMSMGAALRIPSGRYNTAAMSEAGVILHPVSLKKQHDVEVSLKQDYNPATNRSDKIDKAWAEYKEIDEKVIRNHDI